MKINRVFLAVPCLVAVYSTLLLAAHPFNTDDAGVVPDRSFEIEASSGTDFQGSFNGGLVIKYGVSDCFDIGFAEGIAFSVGEERALSAPLIGMKFALIPDKFTLSASSALAVRDFSMLAILSGGFKNTALHVNIGFASDEEEKELLIYAGSLQQVIGSWVAGAELFGNQTAASTSWQVGVGHSFEIPVSINYGFGGSFTSADDLTMTLGITFSPVRQNVTQKEVSQ